MLPCNDPRSYAIPESVWNDTWKFCRIEWVGWPPHTDCASTRLTWIWSKKFVQSTHNHSTSRRRITQNFQSTYTFNVVLISIQSTSKNVTELKSFASPTTPAIVFICPKVLGLTWIFNDKFDPRISVRRIFLDCFLFGGIRKIKQKKKSKALR